MLLCLAISLSIALDGCWWNRNRREPNFGNSVRQAKQAQIINPSTGNTDPVTGMDGQAANNVMQTYRDSFKAEESSKSNNISILPSPEKGSK